MILYLTGIFYFVMGWFTKLKPKKKIGNSGYHTKKARSSQQAWDFAQRYSAVAFQWTGLGLIFLALGTPYLSRFNIPYFSYVYMLFFVGLTVTPVVGTEIALRKHF